jgi:hypothetical protein
MGFIEFVGFVEFIEFIELGVGGGGLSAGGWRIATVYCPIVFLTIGCRFDLRQTSTNPAL